MQEFGITHVAKKAIMAQVSAHFAEIANEGRSQKARCNFALLCQGPTSDMWDVSRFKLWVRWFSHRCSFDQFTRLTGRVVLVRRTGYTKQPGDKPLNIYIQKADSTDDLEETLKHFFSLKSAFVLK